MQPAIALLIKRVKLIRKTHATEILCARAYS